MYPIKNFRFNESPISMLNNIEEIGKPVIIAGDEVPYQMLIPPMKVRDFNFTSLVRRCVEIGLAQNRR